MGTFLETHLDSLRSLVRVRLYPNLPSPLHLEDINQINRKCVSASQSTLVRLVFRSVTPAGSCTAWSTVSSLMARCPVTRPLEVVMTPSTPSSVRLVLANTSPGLSLWIWNPLLWMRSALAPTASCSTLSSRSLVRRMLPTTTPVVTTPLVRRLLTSSWTGSVSWLISALVSRASSSSTALVVVLALASPPCSWRGCLLTMARSPSWSSLSTQPPRCLLLWLSPTTQSCPPIPPWSTLTAPLWLTMRPSMTYVVAISMLKDQLTPTSTDSSPRLCLQLLPPSDSTEPSMSI